MTKKNTGLRRLLAGTGAFALALAGTFATSQIASADVGPDQPKAPTSGTLTINKYSGSPTETLDPDNLLDGVEFTVTQVGRLVAPEGGGDAVCTAINLTNAAEWDGLDALFATAPAAPASSFCLTTVVQDKVTVDGSATFPLAVGIYFVQETDPGPHSIVSPVPNFYVSIPTSDSGVAGGWNYNVVANPKNQLMEGPEKTIQEAPGGLVVGSTVTWDISVPIPVLNNNETFTSASISDTLDARLSYASSTVRILEPNPAPEVPNPLVEGTHYTVTGKDTGALVWTFTEAGRLLLDANPGKSIQIELVTTVDEVGDGGIPNDDYESEFNDTVFPGEEVPYTYWGELKITKVDDSATPLNLAGAEFQVFLPNDGGTCEAEAPATGPLATGTSNASGVVQWVLAPATADDPAVTAGVLGLWIANSDSPLTDPSKDYCVYETVVPSGHSGDKEGKLVTITPGGPVANASDITVVNPKTKGPDLPLTGAQGTIAMSIGGLLLVGAGVAVALVSRRRNHTAA